jgi:hypothetical protein
MQGARIGFDAWPISYKIAGGSSAGQSPMASVERRAPSAGELSLIQNLRDQFKYMQQEVKRIAAQVDVACLKASRAADAEQYLIGEVENLGKAMKCKYPSVVESSLCLFLLNLSSAFLLLADACLDDKAEARQVNVHLNAAWTHANSVVDCFWADRSKAEALTVLHDQISQAGVLAETCRSALAVVHQVMFPQNDQPNGLPALLT